MDLISTFEAAEYCGVSYNTISRWIDSGKLKGFRTAGGHRKIYKSDLIEFMKSNGMLIDEIEKSIFIKILIIEDEDEMIDIYNTIFDRNKFKLEIAKTGFDAGAKLTKFMPDLVILDIMLPDIDGKHVCSYIKSKEVVAKPKILIVTGLKSKSRIQEVIEIGADDYLTKPFEPDELFDKIYELIEVKI